MTDKKLRWIRLGGSPGLGSDARSSGQGSMWKAALAAGVTALSAVAAAAQVNPADLKWGPGPASLPRGATMALLSGDPGKSGVFVIRLNMPAGYKIPAHHHPTDEYVTVISGDFHL